MDPETPIITDADLAEAERLARRAEAMEADGNTAEADQAMRDMLALWLRCRRSLVAQLHPELSDEQRDEVTRRWSLPDVELMAAFAACGQPYPIGQEALRNGLESAVRKVLATA